MSIFKLKQIPTKYDFTATTVENNYSYLSSIKKYDVVFAGDSITWLFPIDELIDVKAAGRGISGDTSDQLLRRWDNNVSALDPKLIVLLIGVNDIAHRRPLEDILKDTFGCIDKSIAHNKDVKIILEAVYPTDNKPNRRNGKIEELNNMLEEKAKEYDNVTFINYYKDLLNNKGIANPEYFYDGLHPNAKGFDFISKKLNPLIKEILG